jgi:glycosyltransferase involved in cell wall biosynthesis
MQPLVSILIPAFNAAPWIRETLWSALRQSYLRKEIIVVDDGSRDSTFSVAQEFVQHGVKVIRQINQGASAARNHAFSVCSGDYVQWLDADDLLAPDKIEKQMAAFSKGASAHTLVTCPWGSFRYRTSAARFRADSLWCNQGPNEWLRHKLGENLFMQPASWLVSRELTLAAGPWDIRLSLDDDGEYFCRVVRLCDEIRFLPETRVFYRRSGIQSLSQISSADKKLESQLLSLQLQIDCLRSLENSERVRTCCLRFLQSYMIFFYPERPDLVKRAQQLAVSLGGALSVPRLALQYAMIQRIFGWKAAKNGRASYNRWKLRLADVWDRILFQFGF